MLCLNQTVIKLGIVPLRSFRSSYNQTINRLADWRVVLVVCASPGTLQPSTRVPADLVGWITLDLPISAAMAEAEVTSVSR